MSAIARAVVKHPGKPAEVAMVGKTLSDLHKLVDGYVDVAVKAPDYFGRGLDLLVYVNDEGLLRQLPPNLFRPTDGCLLVGVIVAVKSKRADGYPIDMTEDEAAKALALVSSWKAAL